VGGKPVDLSQREFSILECLLRRPGQVLSRDQLLDYAWPYGVALTPNTVEAYIHLLRDKIGPDAAAFIETVRGVGYRLREG
jgi:DNA-binding response OmpR family regulator